MPHSIQSAQVTADGRYVRAGRTFSVRTRCPLRYLRRNMTDRAIQPQAENRVARDGWLKMPIAFGSTEQIEQRFSGRKWPSETIAS